MSFALPCIVLLTMQSVAAARPEPPLKPPATQSLISDEQEARQRLADDRLLDPLRTIVPEVALDAMPFDKTLDWLARQVRLENLHVRWQVVIDAGVNRETPISLRVRSLSAGRVLRQILDDAGASDIQLAFGARDGILIVSTKDDLQREDEVQVYPVRDLLLRGSAWWKQVMTSGGVRSHDPNDPSTDPAARDAARKAADESFKRALSRLDSAADAAVGHDDFSAFSPFDAERLIEIIQCVIEPDTWELNNGRGTIRAYHSSLIVRNSRAVHREIDRLLKTLRRADNLKFNGSAGLAPAESPKR